MYTDENTDVPVAFFVDSARLQHYDEVINHMTKIAIGKYVAKHESEPDPEAVSFYKRELARIMSLGRNIDAAQKIELASTRMLCE